MQSAVSLQVSRPHKEEGRIAANAVSHSLVVLSQGINIEVTLSERGLLAYLLAKVHRIDPDIIIVSALSLSLQPQR